MHWATLPAVLMLLATAADDTKTYEDLVNAAPLPSGYSITRHDIKEQGSGKALGTQLILTQRGQLSTILISREDRELPTPAHRLAAMKGYVNGTAKALEANGLKLVDKELPDVAKLDLTKRVTARLTFENQKQEKVYVEIQVFFTTVGYNILVVADDSEKLEMLSKWASSVTAKE